MSLACTKYKVIRVHTAHFSSIRTKGQHIKDLQTSTLDTDFEEVKVISTASFMSQGIV